MLLDLLTHTAIIIIILFISAKLTAVPVWQEVQLARYSKFV